MRSKKFRKTAVILLSALSLSFVGAGEGGGWGDWGDWGSMPEGGWEMPEGGWGSMPGGNWGGTRPNAEPTGGLTESTEVTEPDKTTQVDPIAVDSDVKTLYLDALSQDMSQKQKFVTLKRGNYTATASLAAKVEYPVQQEITVTFPYGTIYMMGASEQESKYREAGDVIVYIRVEVDAVELARIAQQVQRMEERGETYGYYTYLKNMLDGMVKATTQTEIVMEEGGYLVDFDRTLRGAQISKFSYTVADPTERILSVENKNNQFRYGQKVTVTGTLNNKKVNGTGTVISASQRLISEDLANSKAYIRLEKDSEELYDATGLSVSVESIRAENILLLDASCVYAKNGVQLVKIKDETGLHMSGFIFGRKSSTQYWIVDGLEEGTQVLVQ